MPTMNAYIDFEVWCSCGEGLCGQTGVNGTSVTVEPCQACLEKAHEEGYERGKGYGHTEGFEAGRLLGFEEGKTAAMRVIREEGRG